MDPSDKPVLPTAALSYIGRWRKRIEQILVPRYLGSTVEGTEFEMLSADISKAIKRPRRLLEEVEHLDDTIVATAVRDTVKHCLAGQTLDLETAKLFAVRVAGNMSLILRGESLTAWRGQPYPEWVLVVVQDARPYTTPRRHIDGGILKLSIASGLAAGEVFEAFFSNGQLKRMAVALKMLDRKHIRTIHPRELGRAYFMEIGRAHV